MENSPRSALDLEGLLESWHNHRVSIFLAAAILLTGISLLRKHHWPLKGKQPASATLLPNEKPKVVPVPPASAASKAAFSQDTKRLRPKATPKTVRGDKLKKKTSHGNETDVSIKPVIFFSSLTGSTETYSTKVLEKLKESTVSQILEPEVHDLSYIDYDDFFVTPPKSPSKRTAYFYLILVPSYNIDTVLDNFLAHLNETHHDFRIDTAPLAGLVGYSVFGFGDKEGWPSEGEGFCFQAKEADKWMAKLTNRKRAFPLGMGDVKSDAQERLDEWVTGVGDVLQGIAAGGGLGEGVEGSGDPLESDEEEYDAEDVPVEEIKASLRKKREGKVADLEDLGGQREVAATKSGGPVPVDFTSYGNTPRNPNASTDLKPMVPKSSPTYTALTKQGYTIVGSHSGVKICRWTKSALRGRGSCYKHSFYGIASHLCMETTPSLSCSNKCVFCWRHGTNPVGTTWRWQIDPPDMIFEGAVAGHLQKIKMMRGVPGVRAERFQEAQRIRHCALSLVGEPIFYPHINEFVSLLHKNHISSFLVCNAQHPEQLANLKTVTQLYVSIDASNKESLKKIDRPLHRDFWERFQKCLDILAERRNSMRTVFRLTLVKGFNIDEEVEGYADLVARGKPCFVEIKGVTYCGTSTSASAGLTMANVPFYEEVQAFVEALNKALARRGLGYGIAAEHAHSCCALLAANSFHVGGTWHTWIDYDRYFELLEEGRDFGPEDYIGKETPEWALWGNGGFDPSDQRVDRKGRPIQA